MKRLNNVKWFTLGIVVCLLVTMFTIPTFASSLTKTATLVYTNIKIMLNGNIVTPKDASGNVVEPFIIDGTTYLPVRAISNALGINVDWDGATKTVKLSEGCSNESLNEQIYDIRNWLVSDIWNAGICDMSHFYEDGKSSTGETMDADFTLAQLKKAIAEKPKYDTTMGNLPEEYSETSELWQKISKQVDILYAEIQNRGTKVTGIGLNTGLYNQYFSVFDDLVHDIYYAK